MSSRYCRVYTQSTFASKGRKAGSLKPNLNKQEWNEGK